METKPNGAEAGDANVVVKLESETDAGELELGTFYNLLNNIAVIELSVITILL